MPTVYDPDTQGERRYHHPDLDHPQNPDPKDNKPAGDSSDPRTIHKGDTESPSDLRDAEQSGGNGLFNPDGDTTEKGKSIGSGALQGRESSGGTGSAGSFNFNPGKQGKSGSSGFRNFFLGSSKRKRMSIGGGIITSVAVSGGLLTMFLVAGPAQLVQLSQLLQHNFSLSESNSQSRSNSLLRSWKAFKKGDYRYTRVGLIGEKSMNKIVGQFEDAGVKFTGSDLNGRPTGIEINRAAIEQKFPETKGMNDAEMKSFLNDKFSVDAGQSFETTTPGESYKLNIEGLNTAAISRFINNASTKILGNGKVVSYVKTRALKKFFGLKSLFHWLSRGFSDKMSAKAAEIKKSNPKESEGEAKTKAATQVEDNAYADSVKSIQQPGVDEFGTVKATENGLSQKIASRITPGLGVLWASGCTLNALSDGIVTLNRSLIVLPAAAEASQLVGIGAEIKYGGGDVTAAQMGAIERGFKDSNGQSIFSGAALQALEGSQKANSLPKTSGGQTANDLPGEYKQAFGQDTTASTLKSVSDIMLSWFPFHYLPGVLGGQCGFAAGATIILAGGVIQALAAIASAPDAGATEIALQSLAAAGRNIGSGYVQGKLLGPVISNILNRIARATVAPKLTSAAFKGAVGGDLIAYGARAAANSAAILNGGIALGNSASTIIGSAGQQEQQQFRSKSFFAKMFDINDYRSLVGHLATSISPSIGTNLRLGINNILNIGGALSSVFGNLIPSASAACNSDSWTGCYNWGFSQFGLPKRMVNDPALSDPPQNSENVGKYLSSVCVDSSGNIGPSYGACSGSNGYTARIMACFGNKLTYTEDSDIGANVWDVEHAADAASSDVNPVSDTYQAANCAGICPHYISDCGNTGEEQWEKIVMFVYDAHNIKGVDCVLGNSDTSQQSCADAGIDTSGGSTGTPTSPTPSGNYTNPFPGGWVPNRLDMGYDGTFKGQIVAPFSGTVTYAGAFNGWCSPPGSSNCSDGVIIKADKDFGMPTKCLYFTEGVSPITSLEGKHVNVGTPIANATASPYGAYRGQSSSVGAIEWGVASDCPLHTFVNTEAVTLGAGNCKDSGGPGPTPQSRKMVLNFSQWAQSALGLPPPSLTTDAGCA